MTQTFYAHMNKIKIKKERWDNASLGAKDFKSN
jgi:hypothetical protein